ncbi:MAG: glutaminyl-peptide cyclotransferase [Flavobacteriaceae bacterium]
MSFKTLLSFVLISSFLFSCKTDYKFTLNSPKKITIDQELIINLEEKNSLPYDGVVYKIDGKKIGENNPSIKLNIANYSLGKHLISVEVSFEGKQKKINREVYFLSDRAPIIYDFEVIASYPHDEEAFTQGLEYKDGFLYESTGQYKGSTLRKVALETGEIIKKIDLGDDYFGEGLSIFNDQIYVLTWRAKKGFIYDLESFEKTGEFNYGQSKEGWGLTHSETELIKSDGTEYLWFLNVMNQKELRNIQAYTNKRKAEKLNELEMVEGLIYANLWQKDSILIIDPSNGAIVGIADLSALKKRIKSNGDADQVLNGIAYDSGNKRLFVTGKNWNKLFEIKLTPRSN